MKLPQTVPDLFYVTREAWLENARLTARLLLRTRSRITIEDVLTACPRPKYIKPNVTGSVFKDPMFVPVGFTQSNRAVSHGRVVRMWALDDAYVNEKAVDCE